MTKLLLITSDFPPRLGGTANYYAGLWRSLPELSILTNVIGASRERVYQLNWTWAGWPRWLPLLWLVPWWQKKYGRRLLAAGEILPIGTALLIMNLAFGWSYLVFTHGLDVQLTQRNFWKKWLTKMILTRARLLVANSEFTSGLLLKAGAAADKIIVLYPVVSVPKSQPELVGVLRQRYSLTEKRVVLTVARLVPRKGLAKTMLALSQIAEQLPQLTYLVVGDGPLKSSLVSLAATLKYKIIFTGAVSEEEKQACYELADIFVLTPESDTVDVEGFGIVYLEAMAHGLPVIASRVGGVPEAVGQGGLLIDDISELPAAVNKLLTDQASWTALSSAARHQAAKFSNLRPADLLRERLKLCS